jgi:uncharacterized membrane protein
VRATPSENCVEVLHPEWKQPAHLGPWPIGQQHRRSSIVKVDVTTEIVINRPASEVSSYAADPDNAPEWYANITSVEWTTEPPIQQGSLVAFVAQFLGKRLAYTYEIAEHQPGQRLVMRTQDGPFPMVTTYTWVEQSPTTTRMTLRNAGEPAGFSTVAAPVMSRAVRRANRKDLARLKSVLEQTQPSP